MGRGQPPLCPAGRPDRLELARIAGDQVSHPCDLGPRRQQCLLRAGLESPAHGEDDRGDNHHCGNHQAGQRHEHPDNDTRQGTRDESRDDRHRDPDLRIHDVTEVVHDAGEQVGATTTTEPRRSERNQSFICRGALVGEVGQGHIMRTQSLPVAEDRPGHAEGSHGDDGGEQQEDDGSLASADDQPA